jgi:hypothetical protein
MTIVAITVTTSTALLSCGGAAFGLPFGRHLYGLSEGVNELINWFHEDLPPCV